MAAARPQVTVYSTVSGEAGATATLPAVFKAPIRPDVVVSVHTSMLKNKRQPYAVKEEAGHQCAAESWGTGRAVSRIPRVSGGGTSRSGQGAFGNMCRGGRMFAPTKVWRRWHRRINQNQRRFATASALAASALPALVMARGHKIDGLPQVPLVISNEAESLSKTKEAVAILTKVGAMQDVERSKASRSVRTGQGKMRNRRHVQRRGPLVVYDKNEGIRQAFRNLPGVDLCAVDSLNLLQLAPGGHVGRFIIWTEGAFKRLDSIWGTQRKPSAEKTGYHLPRPTMTNPDVARLINSDAIQSVVRPVKDAPRRSTVKKNPLRNLGTLLRLNPYAQTMKRQAALFQEAQLKKKQDALNAKRA